MLLPAHLGERLISPSRLRPVHRAVKLNQFPARIRPSRARHKAQTAFPARIRHSQARQKVQTAFPARIRHSQARQRVQTAFLARIRHSQARHFATNCRPGTSIHPQTLLTDRCKVHFTALARVFVTFPPLPHYLHFWQGFRPYSTGGKTPLCAFRANPRGLGAEEGTRLLVSGNPRGLGAGSGTRLSVSGDSARSRCRRRDETMGFRGFRVVSVPKVGRDCLVSGESVWSRCRRWDETAWFPAISCGLGAEGGTRLSVSSDFAWSRCRKWDETARLMLKKS